VADLEPLTTDYIQLNYMRADEAQTMLYGFASGAFLASAGGNAVNCSAQAQGLGGAAAAQASQKGEGDNDQKVLTKRGRATYELKTNTLIITDTASKIQEVRELLTRLDVPARQVMIEARVVVATDGWSRDLGARLSFDQVTTEELAGDLYQGRAFGVGQALPASFRRGQPGLVPVEPRKGNLLSGVACTRGRRKGQGDFQPACADHNQKPAVILNGTQIPYITPGRQLGGVATVTFKDAFLCLLVDPQILNNDSIILTVEVQKDAVRDIANIGDNPAIDTKRIKTQVRVNNGETLVLGGIFDGSEGSTVSKVPLLGDIPLLGQSVQDHRQGEQQDRADHLHHAAHPRRARVAALIAVMHKSAGFVPRFFSSRIFRPGSPFAAFQPATLN
jgi:type IV pilus assembly protein PilQ